MPVPDQDQGQRRILRLPGRRQVEDPPPPSLVTFVNPLPARSGERAACAQAAVGFGQSGTQRALFVTFCNVEYGIGQRDTGVEQGGQFLDAKQHFVCLDSSARAA